MQSWILFGDLDEMMDDGRSRTTSLLPHQKWQGAHQTSMVHYRLFAVINWCLLLTEFLAKAELSNGEYRTSTVVSETVAIHHQEEGDELDHDRLVGVIRYHYDVDVPSCRYVLLLGVGTFMSVTDYDKISTAIVGTGEPIVVVIADHNVEHVEKTSPTRYATLMNEFGKQIDDIIPICSDDKHHIGFGGHSASGEAAMQAWQQDLIDRSVIRPLAFVGLDPYEISDKTIDRGNAFDLPGLYWGFTRTTCLVDIDKAATAAYNFTEPPARVLYSIHNDEKKITHCVFTDHGCGVGPVGCGSGNVEWIYEKVANSIALFVQALANPSLFQKDHFELPGIPDAEIDVFVNGDSPALENEDLSMQTKLGRQMLRSNGLQDIHK